MKKTFIVLIALLISIPVFSQEKTDFKKRYVNHTEVGILFGQVKYGVESTEKRQTLTVQMYQGIQLNPSLSAGAIVGIDWYKSAVINPLALGVRYDVIKGSTARLYASADAGVGFTWFNNNPSGYKTTGGLLLNPGIGVKFGKADGTVATIGLSWRRQEAGVNKPTFIQDTERSEKRVYNRIALRVGMAF